MRIGETELDERARVLAEEPVLIDGLVGAATRELGRPIGAQHEHRHGGHRRFDDGRQIVGRRRTRRAKQQTRPCAESCLAEREESRGALIDDVVDTQRPPTALLGRARGFDGGQQEGRRA